MQKTNFPTIINSTNWNLFNSFHFDSSRHSFKSHSCFTQLFPLVYSSTRSNSYPCGFPSPFIVIKKNTFVNKKHNLIKKKRFFCHNFLLKLFIQMPISNLCLGINFFKKAQSAFIPGFLYLLIRLEGLSFHTNIFLNIV